MDVCLDFVSSLWATHLLREERPDRRRDKSSSIESWKWKNIDDSEIDREQGNNDQYYLPRDSEINERDESSPHTDRSCDHRFSDFAILGCIRNYEIFDRLSEDIESHIRENICLIHSTLESIRERVLKLELCIHWEIFIANIASDFSILGKNWYGSIRSCSMEHHIQFLILPNLSHEIFRTMQYLIIQGYKDIPWAYSCMCGDTSWERSEFYTSSRDISTLDGRIWRWKETRMIVFLCEKIRSNRGSTKGEKSKKDTDSQEKIHPHSCHENKSAWSPWLCREGIWIERFHTHRIFSLDPYESSDGECIECVLCSLLIGEYSEQFGWNTETELKHLHPCESCRQEVSQFMDQNDNEKDKKCQEDTEEDGHGGLIDSGRYWQGMVLDYYFSSQLIDLWYDRRGDSRDHGDYRSSPVLNGMISYWG